MKYKLCFIHNFFSSAQTCTLEKHIYGENDHVIRIFMLPRRNVTTYSTANRTVKTLTSSDKIQSSLLFSIEQEVNT